MPGAARRDRSARSAGTGSPRAPSRSSSWRRGRACRDSCSALVGKGEGVHARSAAGRAGPGSRAAASIGARPTRSRTVRAEDEDTSRADAYSYHDVHVYRSSALDRIAAIHRNGGAGDEVGGGAGEEHRDAGHVVGHAPAPGGRALQHALVQARRPLGAPWSSARCRSSPGSTALTWMLSRAHADAPSTLVSCTMPPLLAA